MSKLSSKAILNPIPVIVFFLTLTILGIFSFKKLPINADPNTQFPIVTVTVSQSGASPDEMENTITRQVENTLSGMAGVRNITSTITEGTSTTTVEFLLDTDTDRAVNDVRNAVSQIRSDLPSGITEPTIERMDVEGGAMLYYAVESPNMNQTELSWFIDDTINRQLLSVQGVQKVQRLGGEKREILVALKPEQLNALGISADYISTQLAQTNLNMPAGRTQLFGKEQSIRVSASQASVEDLANLPIALSDNRQVKLGDLADIADTHAQVRSRTRLNGREVLGFTVSRAKGTSDTVVADAVVKKLDELMVNQADIRITQVQNTVDTTKSNYTVAISTLLEGAALTVLVVWLFLRSWRATLVAAISLPLSILPTFVVMLWLDYTLNSITLLAITLVIGILVDDAIVEIENIEQHLHQGKRPFQAAIDAADGIGFAVVAITATIVAVFMPVSFISGMTGQFFSQFGITVSAAVLASLLVARLATPLLAAYILAPLPQNHAPQKSSPLKNAYLKLLDKALHYRKLTLVLGAGFLVGSFALATLLPTGFMPKGDTGVSQIDITLPPSTTVQQTDEYLQKIDRTLRNHSEVDSVFITVASGGEVNKGEVLIKLVPHKERTLTQKQFEDKIRDELATFADMRFAFRNEMAARDVSILLTGNDANALNQTALELKKQMQGLSTVENVQINAPLLKPELQVELLPTQAALAGVTPQAVANVLQIATVGNTDGNSAKFNFPDRQVPIRVTLPENARNNLDTLNHLRVPSSNGGTVALNTVAKLSFRSGSSSIERFNRERRISVDADLAVGQTLGTVLNEVNELPILKNLPNGVRSPQYGDGEMMNEMFEQFGLAILFGISMVFMVLILLFKDFLQPITILIALPLSIGGAVGGLLLHGSALDMSSVIGILMLMGIVTKNSILLVDFVIEKRNQGMERSQALIQSGFERVRPIMMTTIAMVAGMLPAVFAGGAGAAFRAPMAIAVIGGLMTSTLLSLVFVPVVYSCMDDLKSWILPKLAKLTSVTKQDKTKYL